MGSNGLTSARHDVFSAYLASKYPESFDTSLPHDLDLFRQTKTDGQDSMGLILTPASLSLSPTRTYAPVIVKILETMKPEIHGMIHCSGGGQTKIMHFIDDLHVIKDNMFPVPPLFRIIQEQSGTSWHEMYRVFNMGHRFEIYTDEKNADEIIDIASGFNLEAKVIGHCEASDRKRLTIETGNGIFEY